MPTLARIAAASALLICLIGSAWGQTSTGSISGTITDQNGASVAGAVVTLRNVNTGLTRSGTTDSDGNYSFPNVPIGAYEVLIEAATFSRYLQSGIQLTINQNATVSPSLTTRSVEETVTVRSDASLLNATTPEVATRFDERRLSGIPIAPDRNLFRALLSVPGSSPRLSGVLFMLSLPFTINGGRIRSNSFILDGQDINDPVLTGSNMPLNNPDAIQEVRIVTNQFLPEYGHNAGSVTNIVGKSGTNDLRGTLFWFHNDQALNACSNLDKRAGFCNRNASDESRKDAPFRIENQIGFTIGGPVMLPRFGEGVRPFYTGKDKTFFFTDYQRWSDRRLGTGITLNGAPTAEGRRQLEIHAGTLQHVQELLRFVPAGIPNGEFRTITANGSTFDVELGNLTGSSDFRFDSHQGSVRIDHRYNDNNLIYGRYRYSYEHTSGTEQVTPPGLATLDQRKHKAAVIGWTSLLSPNVSNEARIAWSRSHIDRDGEDPRAKSIPSIQILDIGMTSPIAGVGRTAFGLAINLPVVGFRETYQMADDISIHKGEHSFKFGVDLRRTDSKSISFPSLRGSLEYATLNDFVNDIARSASKTLPLVGGDFVQFTRWHEVYFYGQDQWKLSPNLTLSYGIRYEYPGDQLSNLRDLNKRILAAYNNDPAFRFEPLPKVDTNNWMPRIGINWNPRTKSGGIVGFLTGGSKLVFRAGYARAYDPSYARLVADVFSSFPFVASQNTSQTSAFTTMIGTTVPDISNPWKLNRTVFSRDYRSPATDQISINIQRELSANMILKVAYIRTRGTGLFQTVQGNPKVPCLFGTGTGLCNTTGIDRNTGVPLPAAPEQIPRVDPTRGEITVRANSASSTYDALQTSLEKRLSHGVSFGLHYTWSSFIDTASDVVGDDQDAGLQDPFDWNRERGRSRFDIPHRLTGNIVYELPFFRKQKGIVGKFLGGWQINSFFSFQSGAPFTVLNGSDPAGVGGAIRPNIFTGVDISRMSIPELYQINQQLRAQVIAQAQTVFNAMPRWRCVNGWLPGPPLPVTLFSAPRGRVICGPLGERSLVIEVNGVPEGQRVGNAGRNILRADSLKSVDIGFVKNTRVAENVRAQICVDFFNAFNWRNFGIPSRVITDPGFLNQWATDGGNRRIRIGARLVF